MAEGAPPSPVRRIVFCIVKTVQVFVSPSNSLRETAVYANSDGKTRWFLLLFHGRPIHCRIGQVSWLVRPPASQARPWVRRNIVKYDTSIAGTLPGRCRGWSGCQPPAAGHRPAASRLPAACSRPPFNAGLSSRAGVVTGGAARRLQQATSWPAASRRRLPAGSSSRAGVVAGGAPCSQPSRPDWYYWLVLAGITGWYYLLLLAGIIGWYYWSVLAGMTGW